MTAPSLRVFSVSLVQFAVTFVPFGVLLAAALLLPEQGGEITLHRVIYTIRLSTLLLIPGLCLYVLPRRFAAQDNIAALLIGFAYVAYIVHFYYATFQIFGGVAEIFTHMRPFIAVTNIVVTVLWTLDTFLVWLWPRDSRWARRAHAIFYLFLFIVFVVTDIFLRPGPIRYLGVLMAVVVPLCALYRLCTLSTFVRPRATPAPVVSTETPGIAKARLRFAFATFILSMAVAYFGAELRGYYVTQHPELFKILPPQWLVYDYYQAVATVWATIVLLTAALCAFVLARPGTINSYWRGFWTVAFFALLVHLHWTVGEMFGFDFKKMLQSGAGQAEYPELVVEHPAWDMFVTIWWGFDVLMVWLVRRPPRWVRLQRGAIHGLIFVTFFGAFAIADKASPGARLLGVAMALCVTGSFLFRVLRFESDSKSFLMTVYRHVFKAINLVAPWYKLPTPLAIANLGVLRDVLRDENLHDTAAIPVTRVAGLRTPPDFQPMFLQEREQDGFYNDLSKIGMGSSAVNTQDSSFSSEFDLSQPGARFGRNIPLSEVGPLPSEPVLEPNPRLISNMLLARTPGSFTPATTLNLLAAAWIQFQTHDWFNHGAPVLGNEFEVPLPAGDNWVKPSMTVRRTRPDPTRQDPTKPYPDSGPADGYTVTYANAETHWWDGSEIYGSSLLASNALRASTQGKLIVSSKGLPELQGMEESGLTVNWWLGLSLLHDLFVKEHNAICDRLLEEYPSWSSDQIYRVARLVNSALVAKIHTVDWTPAILGHPALQIGMRANWWGLLTENVKKSLGRLSESEAFSGIAGSRTDHHGADYCLTEEFTSVYRMHPLLPESIKLYSMQHGALLKELKLGSPIDNDPEDVVGPLARDNALEFGSMSDIMYSFGIDSPGALILQNYPTWMRRLRRFRKRVVDEIIDLATIDIVRDRERGVPRYNRFRRLFHLPEFASMDEMIQCSRQLRENPALAENLRQIYKNDVNQVDLMVGMFAETPPEGFGFSDTAFRVFILMASRRIKSDRFLTDDFTADVYTQVGLDWVENNNMKSVLTRHYPELTVSFQEIANPFAPWRRINAGWP